MSGAILLLHALSMVPEVSVQPIVHQSAVIVLRDETTAGGAGGGVGAQLLWNKHLLAQLDVGALFLLGNVVLTRAAVGVQMDSAWCPAAWLTFNALWGDRVEFLASDGGSRGVPIVSIGVRAAALRFSGALGTVSLLEPGAATDWHGGLMLELTIAQAGARF
jgi:hypothetical protein